MFHDSAPLVIIGGGVAGRAAAAILPQARLIARPDATVWNVQAQTLWIETADGLSALTFARLLLCADEPLLLLSLGCAFRAGWPVVDARGETSRPGVFAAGRVLGATTCEAASEQARIVARVLADLPPGGRIAAGPPTSDPPPPERLDPVGIAALVEQPPGPGRNRAALAQAALLGAVLPARPVGFAALAAAAGPVADRPTQQDAGRLA
jgi:hypothetical protein